MPDCHFLPCFLIVIIFVPAIGVVASVTTGLIPSTVNSAGEVTSASGLSWPCVGSYIEISFFLILLPPTNSSNSLADLGVNPIVIALVLPSAVYCSVKNSSL